MRNVFKKVSLKNGGLFVERKANNKKIREGLRKRGNYICVIHNSGLFLIPYAVLQDKGYVFVESVSRGQNFYLTILFL